MLSYLQPANKYKISLILSPMLYTGYIIQMVLPTYVAEAPNRRLAVFSMISRPCTDFLTRPPTHLLACLSACLPVCLSICLSICLPVSV